MSQSTKLKAKDDNKRVRIHPLCFITDIQCGIFYLQRKDTATMKMYL